MATDLDPISNEELKLIKQLRNNVSDLNLDGYFDTDLFYIKWIRARELHVDRAEEMLRKNILWRRENDIGNIISWEPDSATVPVDFPLEISGYNKFGSPVVIIPYAYWDVRRGVEAGLGQVMVRYIDQVLEVIEDTIRQQSTPERPVTQGHFVFDVNGLSFWQLASMKTIEIILDIVRRYEANHPEVLHKASVVNASRIFYILFNMVKPFLTPRTMAKISVYTCQPAEWTADLRKTIAKDQLPVYFGGTARTSLKVYQEINSSKQRIGLPRQEDDNDNLTTININPEEKVLVTFDVAVPNSVLRWEFRTDYYDIQFGVYREGNESSPYVPKKRYPSWMKKIKGEITCDKPGQYVAEFDNKYSEIRRAKTLRYFIQVLSPEISQL